MFPNAMGAICVERTTSEVGVLNWIYFRIQEMMLTAAYFSLCVPLCACIWAASIEQMTVRQKPFMGPSEYVAYGRLMRILSMFIIDTLRVALGRGILLRVSALMFGFILVKDLIFGFINFGMKALRSYLVFCLKAFHKEAQYDLSKY